MTPERINIEASRIVEASRANPPEIQAEMLENARRLAVTEKDDARRRIIVEFVRLMEQEP